MKIIFQIIDKQKQKVIYRSSLDFPDNISKNVLMGSLAYKEEEILQKYFMVKFTQPRKKQTK